MNQYHDSDINPNDIHVLHEKLHDAETPGFVAEFDPDEATTIGIFMEDALSEADAIASWLDQQDITEGDRT